MKFLLSLLTSLRLWLTAVDLPDEPPSTVLCWADLPTHHPRVGC